MRSAASRAICRNHRRSPSEILNARPYAFLDNAPLEERRTQAVYTRRSSERNGSDGLGVLDAAAIDKVVKEAWPEATNADELHDALMLLGVMTAEEMQRTSSGESAEHFMSTLVAENRATRLILPTQHSKHREVRGFWIAAERLPMIQAIYPNAVVERDLTVPDAVRGKNLGTSRRNSRTGSRANGSLRACHCRRANGHPGVIAFRN